MVLKEGTRLQNGKYEILRVLGQGGFGITYEAEQIALMRTVAIKEFFMKDSCERNQDTFRVFVPTQGNRELVERFRSKFIREARMLASLNHPNIVRIHDVFEENDTAYYVMEYLTEGSLYEIIKENGPFREDVAELFIRQIASALDYIHSKNMVHLDVKPSNVMLSSAGDAVLVDFGTSKHYDIAGEQTSITLVGYSRGYAPLEQYRDCDVSHFKPSTDIYSLGATFYTLVTGLIPPDATIVSEDGLERVSAVSDRVWNTIVQSMMSRKKRPQSIQEFLSCLSIEDKRFSESITDIKAPSQHTLPSSEETIIITPQYAAQDEYVDLGLSVKWATCNIGASSPSELGGHYSWGEVAPKSEYSWMTYKFWRNNRGLDNRPQLSKYSTSKKYGTLDNLIRLEEKDDVAHVVLGGKWRMPTYVELEELLSKCQWEWTSRDGVNGYLVKSRINGNSIFMPVGGLCFDGTIEKSSKGFYWLSTIVEDCPNQADALVFDEFGPYLSTFLNYFINRKFDYDIPDMDRYLGCLVRPVIE